MWSSRSHTIIQKMCHEFNVCACLTVSTLGSYRNHEFSCRCRKTKWFICVCVLNTCLGSVWQNTCLVLCSEVQTQHSVPSWPPSGRAFGCFYVTWNSLFPSKNKAGTHCFTMLWKSAKQAEKVRRVDQISLSRVAKHQIYPCRSIRGILHYFSFFKT